MCLDELVKYKELSEEEKKWFTPQIENNHKVGWKIFQRSPENKPTGFYYSDLKERPFETWINEIDYRYNEEYEKEIDKFYTFNMCIEDLFRETYPPGWHIWLTKKPIEYLTRYPNGPAIREKYIIAKVYFKEEVAMGYDDSYPTIVAKEIFILRPEK